MKRWMQEETCQELLEAELMLKPRKTRDSDRVEEPVGPGEH